MSPIQLFIQRDNKVETIKSKRLVEKGCKKPSPPKKGLFKGENKRYNLRGAGRHEIALPL